MPQEARLPIWIRVAEWGLSGLVQGHTYRQVGGCLSQAMGGPTSCDLGKDGPRFLAHSQPHGISRGDIYGEERMCNVWPSGPPPPRPQHLLSDLARAQGGGGVQSLSHV